MRMDKIKAMSIAELQKEHEERKAKLYAYQLDLKSGKEKDTAKVKGMRKDLARILTVLNFKTAVSELTTAVATKAEVAVAENEEVKQTESK